MSHLKTHLGNIQPIIVWDKLILATPVVFMDEVSPHFLGDEPFFVNGVEKDENSTTDSLNLPKDLNCINDPIFDVHISIVIFLPGKQQINGVNNETNYGRKILEGHQSLWSDL